MEVRGTLTGTDIVLAYYLHIKPRPVFAVIGVFILAMAMWALVLQPPFTSWGSGIITVGLLYFVFIYLFYIPLKAYHFARKNELLKNPWAWKFNEDKISLQAKNIDSEIGWNHYKKWKDVRNYILIYDDFNQYAVIPKNWFSDPEKVRQFKGLLGNKIGKAS